MGESAKCTVHSAHYTNCVVTENECKIFKSKTTTKKLSQKKSQREFQKEFEKHLRLLGYAKLLVPPPPVLDVAADDKPPVSFDIFLNHSGPNLIESPILRCFFSPFFSPLYFALTNQYTHTQLQSKSEF